MSKQPLFCYTNFMKTYTKKLSELKPLQNNPNKGSERGDYLLEQSLDQGGIGRSIVIADNDEILGGNHVFEKVGAQDVDRDVIVIETDGNQLVAVKRKDLPDSSDPRAQALIIGDNRASDFHEYDTDVLKALAADNPQMMSEFWHEDELKALLEPDKRGAKESDNPPIDQADELQRLWQVQPGDIYEIESQALPGQYHRVMCGDSTDAEDVGRLMGKEKAMLIFTDPPYNVTNNKWDKFDTKEFITFLEQMADIFKNVLAQNSCLYICLNWRFVAELKLILDKHFRILNWIIWHHVSRGAQFKFYTPSHQDILFYTNGDQYYFDASSELEEYAQTSIDLDQYNSRQYILERNGKHPSDVWYYSTIRGNAHENEPHPTQKPINLVKRAIKVSCKSGAIVTDLFVGSGTTLVACEQEGRIGYGMEIHPPYVAVTLERLVGLGLEPRKIQPHKGE